jgi:hypothetical protein
MERMTSIALDMSRLWCELLCALLHQSEQLIVLDDEILGSAQDPLEESVNRHVRRGENALEFLLVMERKAVRGVELEERVTRHPTRPALHLNADDEELVLCRVAPNHVVHI